MDGSLAGLGLAHSGKELPSRRYARVSANRPAELGFSSDRAVFVRTFPPHPPLAASEFPLEAENTAISPQGPPGQLRSPLLSRQMPGLDILRGVAIVAVVLYHGLSSFQPAYANLATQGAERLAQMFVFGWLGVNLFFVLSGFLITGILIDTRGRDHSLGSFYIRRALRIVPLYLVALALVLFVYHLRPFYVALCVLYAANLAIYFSWIGPIYGPFWSLAVEEQFYLFWPLLVRKLQTRTLALICGGVIVLSPALRALSIADYQWLGSPSFTTWLVLDNLAWGALAAMLLRSRFASDRHLGWITTLLLGAGLMLAALLKIFHETARGTEGGAAFNVVPFQLFFTGLLLLSLRLRTGSSILPWTAPLRFAGCISYGVYLFHLAFFRIYDLLYFHWFRPEALVLTARFLLVRFAVVSVAVGVVCYFSRRYFEDRVLRMKEILAPYDERPTGPPVISSAACLLNTETVK